MDGAKQPEFAEYLRLRRRRQPVEAVTEYEEFLGQIDDFFRLRAVAEDRWREKPNRAWGRGGPLPLDWKEIAEVLQDGDGPPERLITRIARDRFADVSAVGGNLRKTLLRLREKTPLGRVQQIDVACLRWLTRQPGRTAAEKAGPGQAILGVVRRENYDTLENRVFKDFLLRAAGQCGAYLDEFGERHVGHPTVAKVGRFRHLCLGLLEDAIFGEIRGLDRFPSPNYVLQQDGRYSKIWKDYTQLVRQETMATRLWGRREEVDEAWRKLRGNWPEWEDRRTAEGGVDFHTDPRAECSTPIWFNVLDGRKGPLDAPCWSNRLGSGRSWESEKPPVKNGLAIVDLTGDGIWRELLVYGRRDNEKPHLQDYRRPNIELAREWWTLGEILAASQTGDVRAVPKLSEYFEQLQAGLGAEKWVVLVPDDWSPELLERILSAIPLARSNVFLLWRSVAACLDVARRSGAGVQAGERVAVLDGQEDGSVVVSKLEWVESGGHLVPRRRAYRRMKGTDFKRFGTPKAKRNESWMVPNAQENILPWAKVQDAARFASDCPLWVAAGTLSERWARGTAQMFTVVTRGEVGSGGRLFDERRQRGEVAYYDELEGLYLIVTRRVGYDEKPVPVALVEPNERFSGGEEYRGPEIRDFTLKQGEKQLQIYLAETNPSPETPLRLSTTELSQATKEVERLVITTRVTPGQGLAQCAFRFESGRLSKPVRIDLAKMKDPPPGLPRTLLEIEDSLPRSYPPDLPLVEASDALFKKILPDLQAYLTGSGRLWGHEFARPRRKTLPPNPTPIDRLRRENVFGNAPGKELPQGGKGFDFRALFRKLAKNCIVENEYQEFDSQYLRLIAWTYQSECPAFRPIKSALLRWYETGDSLGAVTGYTLLANLCGNPPDAKRLFFAVHKRFLEGMSSQKNVKATHARLCYNLLQFHPEVLSSVDTSECETLMEALEYQYRLKPRNGVLRSMLFLLNRRRYDADFYRVDWDEDNLPSWISQPLCNLATNALREAFIAYVCGKGTLEGIPTEDNDGDDD